jgi:two-component system cell cycle response regulator DivK
MSATILVIEDTPANMKLTAMLLRKSGYEVLEATTASQGIGLAFRFLPELILMDIQLPIMDGLTATKILKTNPTTAGIKIVALTAFAMQGDKERMLAAGCDGYISKPIDYRSFLSQVRETLAAPAPRRSAYDGEKENIDR